MLNARVDIPDLSNIFSLEESYLGFPVLYLSSTRAALEGAVGRTLPVVEISLETELTILEPSEIFRGSPKELSEKGKVFKAVLEKALRGLDFDVQGCLFEFFHYRGPLTCVDREVDTAVLKVLKSLGVEGWVEKLRSDTQELLFVIFEPRTIQTLGENLDGFYETCSRTYDRV